MRFIKKTPLPVAFATQLATKQANINKSKIAKWDLSKVQKNKLGRHLLSVQKHLCCYCEKQIDENTHHIEHFIEQHDDITKIYDYENLFLSCEGDANVKNNKENTSCGHQKSPPRHNNTEIYYEVLLNPSDATTKTLLAYGDDGSIAPSEFCNTTQTNQADYTIKRLNLDSVRLKNERRTAIILIQKQLIMLSLEDEKEYITAILDENQDHFIPFHSALRQNFEFLL